MHVWDKEQKLVKIICNRCGAHLEPAGGLFMTDYVSVEKEWGYFSDKDTQIHKFDLCEKCFDEITAGFIIPVEVEEKTEL